MSMNTERVIRVSAGAAEYVTGKITERFNADITTATFQVGLGGLETPPATWVTPARLEFEGTSVALVSMLVDGTVTPVERAWLWVKTTDTPEILPRVCAGGSITVV